MGDVAVIAVDGIHHQLEGGVDNRPSIFGVEPFDQCSRTFEVSKQGGYRFPLAVRTAPRFHSCLFGQDTIGQMLGRVARRRLGWRLWLNWHVRYGREDFTISSPHQHFAIFICCLFEHFDEFYLQVFAVGVIKTELALQSAIGDPPTLLEKRNDLVEYLVELHQWPSPNSANNALASLRSGVSKPSVNQL